MSVAIDNTGQSTSGTSSGSSTLSSFAVGAGSDRLIFLGVSQWSSTDRVPAATFNGSENFTVHDAATIAEAGGSRRITILKLVAPSNATANIVVTWPGTVDEFVIGATSWTGVDQTTPLGTAVPSTGNGGASSVIVASASGGVVHDAIATDSVSAPNITGNQTQRWRQIAAAFTTEGAGQSAAGTGSNVTCTWSSLNGFYAHLGVAINAAGGGGGTVGRLVGGTLCGGVLVGGLLTGF